METDSNEDLIWRELSRLARAVRRGKRYYLTPRLTRLETYSFSKAILMYAGIQCGGIDYQGIDISGLNIFICHFPKGRVLIVAIVVVESVHGLWCKARSL